MTVLPRRLSAGRPRATRTAAGRAATWNDLMAPTEGQLAAALERIAATVIVGDTRAVRPEARLCELLHLFLLKVASDGSARSAPTRPVDFRPCGEGASRVRATAGAIRAQFRAYFHQQAHIFHADDVDELGLDDPTIVAIVDTLAPWRVVGDRIDVLAKALQVLRADAMKSGEGQFLTHQRIIRPCVMAMEIGAADKVIDPACGSGGFLIEALRQVEAQSRGRTGPVSRFARENLYGVDKDPLGVKLTRAALLAMDGDAAHALAGDAVRRPLWKRQFPALEQALGEREGDFTVVLTNPPFGEALKVSAADARAAGFTISRAAGDGAHVGLEIGLVYLELAHRLLRAGGRVGIVLPETYFFSPSYRWLAGWLEGRFALRGMLNIAMEAFEEFCRAKTNFYIFEKLGAAAKKRGRAPSWFSDRTIMVSTAPTCGLTKGGRLLVRVDPKTGERVRGRDEETGELVDAVNDQLLADMQALRAGKTTDTLRFIPRAQVSWQAAVPVYYDRRYDDAFHAALETPRFAGFTSARLGALARDGVIELGRGHGSPSNEQRVGDVPYIKVSDLRAGLVNINPTNRVPHQLAEKLWRGKSSQLRAFDLLSPERTSKNIGDFCVLMPGQERVLLTREIIVLRPGPRADFDAFYLLWAMTLKIVRDQWKRVVFMQTNREDVGKRYLELCIPVAKSAAAARAVSEEFRSYYQALAAARTKLSGYLDASAEHHFFVSGAEAPPPEEATAEADAGALD